MPTQPRTAAQIAVRASLQLYSVTWRSLSDALRTAWASYADAHPRTDSLGQTVVLSGFQAYIGINGALVASGQTAISAPPTDEMVLTPDFTVGVGTAAGLNISIVQGVIGAMVVVRTSPPVSPGVSFNGDYRIVASVAAEDDDDPILTAAVLTAKWGTLSAGMKFFIKTIRVDATGNVSAPFEKSIVLT